MNKLIIIGNLTRDPELRTTQSGKQVCSFSVAVNRRKDRDGNQQTDYFRVSAWGQCGETCAKYLAKGRKVCVTGAVSTDAYTGRDGKTYVNMDVLADDVEFLSPVSDAAEPRQIDAQSGFQKVQEEDLPF